MKALIPLLALVFAFSLGACKKKPADKGKDKAGHMHGDKVAKDGPVVKVPKEGKEFKPPIIKARVPNGVWICDMGTVHYARGEKGDGICPLCKMKLKPWPKPKAMK